LVLAATTTLDYCPSEGASHWVKCFTGACRRITLGEAHCRRITLGEAHCRRITLGEAHCRRITLGEVFRVRMPRGSGFVLTRGIAQLTSDTHSGGGEKI
jgi:hypothetical protein